MITLSILRITGGSDCRNLGPVSELPIQSVSFMPCANVYVVRGTDTNVLVFLAESPNGAGGQLDYDASRHLFVDSLHEQFDVRGFPVGGSASQTPLLRCRIAVEEGRIRILASSPSVSAIRAACMGFDYRMRRTSSSWKLRHQVKVL